MPNPFEFVRELREMNEALCDRLDQIIDLLKRIESNTDVYGDGR